MPKLQEITAVYLREAIRFDNETAIGECRAVNGSVSPDGDEEFTVKIPDPEKELVERLSYRLYGRWENHHRYGRQFHVKTFIRTQPHGEAGTVCYLQKAPGVGPVTARQLWRKFQGDAVRILREHPDAAAAAADRFSLEKAQQAAAWLEKEKRIEPTLIDLMDLLGGRGFRRTLPKELLGEFGNKAAELIRRNPYLLLRFTGAGFALCDRLYLELGGNPNALKRQAFCVTYSLATDTEGHTWHPVGRILAALRGQVASATVQPQKAAKLAVRAGKITHRRDCLTCRGGGVADYRSQLLEQNEPCPKCQGSGGNLWFAAAEHADQELRLAQAVDSLTGGLPKWPTIASLEISPHQQEMLHQSLQGPLGALCGGPGTGKTYVGGQLLRKLVDRHGPDQVAVAAPTGKAAVRMNQSIEDVGVTATTVHRLLQVEQHDSGGWRFTHGPDNPLPHRFLVIDEPSMIDTPLMSSLFGACGIGTNVLLVGDTGQLPPVGHGAPFRDLLRAGIPQATLTEIQRNGGAGVDACHQVRAGKMFRVPGRFCPSEGDNLALLPAREPQQAIQQIVATLQRIKNRNLADPVWDCQVVVPVNEKSELSRKKLNRVLQAELNPLGERVAGNPFRTGDKIVNTKNGFLPSATDSGEVFVANGELAKVVRVEPKRTIAELEFSRDRIVIPQGGKGDGESDTGCKWELGYALSVHKSQGSEWPVVFVVLDDYAGARLVCSQEWLYTAMSRFRTACFLVGQLSTAAAMIRRVALDKRKTFLVEEIGGRP